MNINLKDLQRRHKFMKLLRDFFDNQDYLEIETPCFLEANTPDPHIDPIFAHSNFPTPRTYQLRTSPEIWLKKALSLGAKRIYEIARVFRDDPPGPTHSKEFTMVEWYKTPADLIDMINDCRIIFDLAHEAANNPVVPSFIELSVNDLFLEHADIDLRPTLLSIKDGNSLKLNEILRVRGDLLPEDSTMIDAFFHVMIKYIEPKIPFDVPVIISRWPIQLAALAASCLDDDLFCDRFEIYYGGLEIANAYQECLDPKILSDRFEQENIERKRLQKPVFSVDAEFLNGLIGQEKTAGIALGVDRLLLAVMKKSHLKELIWGYRDQ